MSTQKIEILKNYKEITKQEAIELKPGTIYLVYNPLVDSIREEKAGNQDIVHNKHAYDKLRYFIGGYYGD